MLNGTALVISRMCKSKFRVLTTKLGRFSFWPDLPTKRTHLIHHGTIHSCINGGTVFHSATFSKLVNHIREFEREKLIGDQC